MTIIVVTSCHHPSSWRFEFWNPLRLMRSRMKIVTFHESSTFANRNVLMLKWARESFQKSSSFHLLSVWGMITPLKLQSFYCIQYLRSALWQVFCLTFKQLSNSEPQEGGWCGHQDFIRLHVLGMEGCLILQYPWVGLIKGVSGWMVLGMLRCYLPTSFLRNLCMFDHPKSFMKHYNKKAKYKKSSPGIPVRGPTSLIDHMFPSVLLEPSVRNEMWGVERWRIHYQEHEPQTNFGHDIGKEFKEATNYYPFCATTWNIHSSPAFQTLHQRLKNIFFLQKYMFCCWFTGSGYDAIAYYDTDIEFQGDITPVLRCAASGKFLSTNGGATWINFQLSHGIFFLRTMTQSSTNPMETFTIFFHGNLFESGWRLVFFVDFMKFIAIFAWWKMLSKRRGGWAIKCGFLCFETGQALVSSLLDTRRQRLPTGKSDWDERNSHPTKVRKPHGQHGLACLYSWCMQ